MEDSRDRLDEMLEDYFWEQPASDSDVNLAQLFVYLMKYCPENCVLQITEYL